LRACSGTVASRPARRRRRRPQDPGQVPPPERGVVGVQGGQQRVEHRLVALLRLAPRHHALDAGPQRAPNAAASSSAASPAAVAMRRKNVP
jgi:hypothetical protein